MSWFDEQGDEQTAWGTAMGGGTANYIGAPAATPAGFNYAHYDPAMHLPTPDERARQQAELARIGGTAPPGTQQKVPVSNVGARLASGEPFHQMQGGGAAQGGQQVSDQAVQDILGKYPATNDGMRAAMVEIDRTFGPGTIKLLDHPTKLDKLVMPDGRTVDTMVGAGAPGASWGWQVEGGGGGGGATLGGVMGGSLLGSPMAGKNIVDDPSYQFVFGEGQKALERSAAAKGTLLTGGTLKALTRYGQGMASTQYGAAYNRAAGEQTNNFNRLFSVAGMGLNATNGGQQQASGYANNIAGAQIGQGNVAAGLTQENANTNANTLAAIGNAAGQMGTDWYNKRNAAGAGSPSWVNARSVAGTTPNPYAGLG